jgi:chaperonin GroEL
MMLLVMEQLQLQLSNEKMLQANPISIKLGMEKATQYLVTQINEFAQPVEDIQSIQQVATISSGNDEIIG